jgi:hypothetical protein
MSDVLKWNSSGSRVLHLNRSGWPEVERGLRLVGVGYLVVFLLAGAGAVLWVLSQHPSVLTGLGPDARWIPELSGALLCLGGALGYLLILFGQWRCLCSAPQDGGAKELLFVCVLATLVAAPAAVAAPYLDDPWDGSALPRLLGALEKREVPAIGRLLQVVAVAMALVSILALSQFARAVAARFKDRLLAWNGGAFFLYVWLLLGGSAGACVCYFRFPSAPSVLAWVTAGWTVCLVWHTLLIVLAWQRVRRQLPQLIAAPLPQNNGQLKPYSGVDWVFQLRVE